MYQEENTTTTTEHPVFAAVRKVVTEISKVPAPQKCMNIPLMLSFLWMHKEHQPPPLHHTAPLYS